VSKVGECTAVCFLVEVSRIFVAEIATFLDNGKRMDYTDNREIF